MDGNAEAARHGIGGNKPPIADVLKDEYAQLIAEVPVLAERANNTPRKIESDDTLAKVGNLVVDCKTLAKRLEEARTTEKEPYLVGGREVDGFFKSFTERLDGIVKYFERAAGDYQREKAAAARRKAEEEARRLREEEERKRQDAEKARRADTAARKADEADELSAKAAAAEAAAATAHHNVEKVKTETGVTVGGQTEWTFTITDYEAIPLDKLRPYLKRDQVEAAIKAYLKIQKGAAKLEGVHFEETIKASFRR